METLHEALDRHPRATRPIQLPGGKLEFDGVHDVLIEPVHIPDTPYLWWFILDSNGFSSGNFFNWEPNSMSGDNPPIYRIFKDSKE